MAWSISNGRWIPAKHLLYTSELLVDVAARRIKRLIVTEPPRHGKSQLISKYFPPWYLGLNPEHRIILTSYESDFAASWGRKSRDIVEQHGEPLFGIKLRSGSSAVNRWDLEGHEGGMNTAGAGAAITGKGGDLIIIDDPFKNAEEANSKRQRDKVWDWYQSTLYTRLEPNGVLVIVQTRWHEDDLVGRLLNPEYGEVEPWVVINLPAVAEQNDQLGRQVGEALWPGRYNLEALAGIKEAVGSYWWNAMYQQRPSPPEGAIIHRTWWKFYRQAPEHFDEVIQSWDCNFQETQDGSYVVGQVWGRKGADKYLLDQFRARVGFIVTKQAIKSMSAKWPQARLKLIEDKANGPAIISSLRQDISGIVPVTPQGSKEARLSAVSPDIEAGNVYLPMGAPWVHDYIEELAVFPNDANDDQVDATSQALSRLSLRPDRDNYSGKGARG